MQSKTAAVIIWGVKVNKESEYVYLTKDSGKSSIITKHNSNGTSSIMSDYKVRR